MQDIIKSDTTIYHEPPKPRLKSSMARKIDWPMLIMKLKSQSGLRNCDIANDTGITEIKIRKLLNDSIEFKEADQAIALLDAYLIYCDETPPKIGDFE
jgi:hypothetical protein